MLELIFRYPVKSMLGEVLGDVRITARGLDGDRAWAVVEVSTGLVASAKHPAKWGKLLQLSARRSGPTGTGVEVELADGRRLSVDDPELAACLTDHLGRQVRLLGTRPEGACVIERTDPTVATLDAAGDLTIGEPTRGALGAAAPDGGFVDYAPVHVIARDTLARLVVEPEADVDVVRFRPNLVVDIPGGPFVENDLAGRSMAIGGDLVLQIITASPRCVVPTLAHGDRRREPAVLRAVARPNRPDVPPIGPRPCVGAYATVPRAGTVAVGDLVSVS